MFYCRHNAAYFDRSASKCLRLCNSDGLFECEGQYDSSRCFSSHFINPYACREARIVFSTWNLDHVWVMFQLLYSPLFFSCVSMIITLRKVVFLFAVHLDIYSEYLLHYILILLERGLPIRCSDYLMTWKCKMLL